MMSSRGIREEVRVQVEVPDATHTAVSPWEVKAGLARKDRSKSRGSPDTKNEHNQDAMPGSVAAQSAA